MDQPESTTRRDRIELIAAVLIAIAAVLTAIATFHSEKLGGDILQAHTNALGQTSLSNEAYNKSSAQQAIERDWFFSWYSASENGEPAAGFLRDAMPREVWALIEEWSAAEDDGILNPFSPEAIENYASYANLPSVELLRQGDHLDQGSACSIFEGRVAEDRSDWYDLSVVFLAITLVTAGLAALLKGRVSQGMVLGTAVVSLVLGAGYLVGGAAEDSSRTKVAHEFFLSDQEGASPEEMMQVCADL